MVAVVAKSGTPLMPTSSYRARKLLDSGRAEIYKHFPFTVRMLDREGGDVQEVEYRCDTGQKHVGVSIASEKHEYASAQFGLLPDEKKMHDRQRKTRRSRRNRKRYRKPRFDNRKRKKGWFAPSIRHAEEAQVRLFELYKEAMPITKAVFEAGSFDMQALQAKEQGLPLPEGEEYQRGPRYLQETLRRAVFFRDGYKCICCGRGIEDNAKFHLHHLGFKNGDHSDRMGNLATACEQCHTPANHQPGGKLYDLEPGIHPLAGAAFMNTVRWHMVDTLKGKFPDVRFRRTYGTVANLRRREMRIAKTHANDAYAMGGLHPKHRSRTRYWEKCRRNDRRLQKFYDAVYVDTRDGEEKTGRQLSSGRIKRSKWEHENLRVYHGKKAHKGHFSIRRGRTQLKAGSIVLYEGERLPVKGTHRNKNGPINVEFKYPAANGKKSASLKKVKVVNTKYISAWKEQMA